MPKRALLVVVLMCAVVSAQAAALVSAHSHPDPARHSCWLCHFGPLPCLEPAAAAFLAPVASVTRLELPARFEEPHEVPLLARYLRGPPA